MKFKHSLASIAATAVCGLALYAAFPTAPLTVPHGQAVAAELAVPAVPVVNTADKRSRLTAAGVRSARIDAVFGGERYPAQAEMANAETALSFSENQLKLWYAQQRNPTVASVAGQ